jgi:hypothetical protein
VKGEGFRRRRGRNSLCKHGEDIALGEIEGEAADVDVRGILVLGMPGALLGDSDRVLPRGDLLRVLHLRQRIHDDSCLLRNPCNCLQSEEELCDEALPPCAED